MDIPDSLNRKVTRALHDLGIDMTPAEVTAERRKAYEKIRQELRKKGYNPPDGDLELTALLKRCGL